jgi:metallo-beta-lactamase class B
MQAMPATRAFDQLYYLGVPAVSAWALNTSDGIILIDTLNNPEEAKTYIEGGLRKFGLDPARIKYILVTHAHGDHYGGAKYLQEKYHPKVLMSAVDWAFLAESSARFGPPQFGLPPTHDMDVVDGQTLTLGHTTLTFYITPGHTPGTVSVIFPVTDKGRPHVVSLLGGSGLQSIDRDPKKGGFAIIRASIKRFGKLSVDAAADAIVSNHPFTDGAYLKAMAIRDGKAGKVSPWVVGKDAVLRFHVASVEAVDAVEAYYEENPALQGPPPGVSPGGGPR